MANEYNIKYGLIINNTHTVSGITNQLIDNDGLLVTSKPIKDYVDINNNILLISLESEISDRISSDESLESAILDIDITNQLSGLTQSLESEIISRISGDTSLELAILNIDQSSLELAINNEIISRISGDTSLESAILDIDITNQLSGITTSLESEISDRISGDTSLEIAIQNIPTGGQSEGIEGTVQLSDGSGGFKESSILDIDGEITINDLITSEDNSIFGLLYNHYVVSGSTINGGFIIGNPDWVVPNSTQWYELFSYVGGESIAGNKLKESGTTYWSSPNSGSTNDYGFNARGSGYRDGSVDGTFNDLYNKTYYHNSESIGYVIELTYDSSGITMLSGYTNYGVSIRLVNANHTNGNPYDDIIIDYDGNTYNVVEIGNQLWISENLRTTKYANGAEIPEVSTTNVTWRDLTYRALCAYDNDWNYVYDEKIDGELLLYTNNNKLYKVLGLFDKIKSIDNRYSLEIDNRGVISSLNNNQYINVSYPKKILLYLNSYDLNITLQDIEHSGSLYSTQLIIIIQNNNTIDTREINWTNGNDIWWANRDPLIWLEPNKKYLVSIMTTHVSNMLEISYIEYDVS